MRIAIVTQPLISNYGGLLQNWALQTVLRREYPGADVITVDQIDSQAPLYIRIGSAIKRKLTGRNKTIYTPDKFALFRSKFIKSTPKARSLKDFRKLDRLLKPDAYIVGSDQVWRPSMVHNIYANFLSFTKCTRKIAYAASFGINLWEFSPEETALCSKLIKEFTAISVREKDGVYLCTEHLGCNAKHVLDPTLLLDAEDYMPLLSDFPASTTEKIFTYILDSNSEKRSFVKQMLKDCHEQNAAHDANGEMPGERPSVEEWLAGIKDAKMVICDSFHGMAFSIIFNKEFYVLGNSQRGNSRLNSLLDLFGLSDRLITDISEAKALPEIDWQKVNQKRKDLILESLKFLHSAL